MRRLFSRSVSIVLFVLIMSLFMTGAVTAAVPQTIYCTDADGALVEVDYTAVIDMATDGDMTMMVVVKEMLGSAKNNFRAVIIVTADGNIVDWAKALDDGVSYSQAQSNPSYSLSGLPTADKYIMNNGTVANMENDSGFYVKYIV